MVLWHKELASVGPSNDYAKAILKVAEILMQIIDRLPESEPLDAEKLMHEANQDSGEGITGNMAGYVAYLVAKYHSRGEEFRKDWNKSWGREDATGVINPAIIEI